MSIGYSLSKDLQPKIKYDDFMFYHFHSCFQLKLGNYSMCVWCGCLLSWSTEQKLKASLFSYLGTALYMHLCLLYIRYIYNQFI